MGKQEARLKIIQACNNWKRNRQLPIGKYVYMPTLYGSRHINQAVCMARRRRLVKSEVLEAAGYRGYSDGK